MTNTEERHLSTVPFRATGPAALFLAVAAAGCASRETPPLPSESEAAVRSELEIYYEDFSARDWEAFAHHFWPEATITAVWRAPGADSIGVVTQSIPEFVALAPQGPDSREIFAEWMIDADITATGTLAQAWVRYGARFGDPGDVLEWEGIDAFTLLKVGGEWRIASLVFAPDAGEAGP